MPDIGIAGGVGRAPLHWGVVVAALALAACTPTDPRVTIVDGWSIGPEAECTTGAACDALVEVATQALSRQGQAEIVRTSIHEEGMYPCKSGGGISPIVRSGAAGIGPIVLFELADGSRRAFAVGYQLGASVPTAHGHGPEVAPWKCSDSDPVPTEHPTEVAIPR